MRQITVYKQTIIDYVDDTRERVAYTLEPQERTSVARHACGGILVSYSETSVAGHLQAPDEAELAARRISRDLCGHAGCLCGGVLGQRGPQDYVVDPAPDGSVRLIPRRA